MISPKAHQPADLQSCPMCAVTLVVVEIGGKDRLACAQCEFVHWNNPKPVTATIVPLDDGVVLVKRKFEPFVGDWCLPGGFIECAEHPAESAAREVFEETGLEVKITKLLGATSPGRGINVVILFYEGSPIAGTLTPGDDAEEARCFKREELATLNIAFNLHRQAIEDWFNNAAGN
ncbi:MAG: NUDIX hydrolase [Candidatus Obscuribacterales bacterium]|nr:NUDIX hydrolase [Candidatus Obscuribacterales bacterium]